MKFKIKKVKQITIEDRMNAVSNDSMAGWWQHTGIRGRQISEFEASAVTE